MKYGLTQSEYDFIQKNVVDPLTTHKAKIWVFGSRARGDHKKFSDLDLLYEPLQDGLNSEIRLIKETLEESRFPYKVDLVNLEDIASSYRTSVLKDRVLWSH